MMSMELLTKHREERFPVMAMYSGPEEMREKLKRWAFYFDDGKCEVYYGEIQCSALSWGSRDTFYRALSKLQYISSDVYDYGYEWRDFDRTWCKRA